MKLQLILFTAMIMMMLVFLQLKHPLAMGLMLIMITINTCLIMGTTMVHMWFAYVLFLVFLGGMLVLFIYTTSLASNEMFSLKINMYLLTMLMISTTLVIMLLMDPLVGPTTTYMMDNAPLYTLPPAMKFYNESLMYITLMLAAYLFLTLIAVVKITKISRGPLRMSN